MKMSKVFHDALWNYSAGVVTVVGRHISGREDWMGPREQDYVRCEADFTKLEQVWPYDPIDFADLKALHVTFLEHYRQGRPELGQKMYKDIDGLIFDLRQKWKNA